MGTAKARELYFTGDRINAAGCERLGIVNRVVPDPDLAKEALALAARIAAGPPIALSYMKDNLNRALTESLESCLDVEAVRAFSEKRAPRFRGR